MQLTLILGIAFAIGAVSFALQNNVPVTVTLALWGFNGSLALVLLLALGIGALIAGIVSSPTVIRNQWRATRLDHRVADLERQLAAQTKKNDEITAELVKLTPPGTSTQGSVDKPYVGLKSLILGSGKESE